MKIRNDTQGLRAVLMRDRSQAYVEPGEDIDLDPELIAIIGPGLSIEGYTYEAGLVLAEVTPFPTFGRRRRNKLPPPPPSLVAKVPGRDPLDHDGDGRKGGSTSAAKEAADEVRDLRAEYQRVIGKRPFNGWDAATLREKIAAAAK